MHVYVSVSLFASLCSVLYLLVCVFLPVPDCVCIPGHVHVYLCVCVCVCVFMIRQTDRSKQTESSHEGTVYMSSKIRLILCS